jgi:myo-inositol 2-dehydrogenase/D-chiro-inositol 1-dehydrogenase
MQRLDTVGQHVTTTHYHPAAAGTSSPAVAAAAGPGDAPLRVGVIGVGGMGGRHAVNISHRINGATVGGIFDMETSRASEVARQCGDAQVFDSVDALIDSAEIDAVVIASPDSTHASLALACVRAGKPVLCEKPLAPSVVEALVVVEAEVNRGKWLIQLGFMWQYDPAHVKVKQALDRGDVGRLLMFRGVHCNLHNPNNPYFSGVHAVATNAFTTFTRRAG